MTRTDQLKAIVTAELEANRASIDAGESAEKYTIVVKTNHGGHPRAVLFSREVERDLTASRH